MKKTSLFTVFASVILLAVYLIGAVASQSSNNKEKQPAPPQAPVIQKTVVQQDTTDEMEDPGDVVEFSNQDFEEEQIDEDMSEIFSNSGV